MFVRYFMQLHLLHDLRLSFCFSEKSVMFICYFLSNNLMTGMGFPCGSVVKNLPANAGDEDVIPGLGRSPGEGNGTPLQYSCLDNPMDRGSWRATVHGVASWAQLSN